MPPTTKRRLALVYICGFMAANEAFTLTLIFGNSNKIIDNALWAAFYTVGGILSLRFCERHANASSILKLVVSVAIAVFVLQLNLSNAVAGLSLYATNILGALLAAFLGYAVNIFSLCFGLFLVVGVTTGKLPQGGSVAVVRFTLLVAATSMARSMVALIMYGFMSGFPEATYAAYVLDSLLAASLYCFPFYYLMRTYIALPGKEGGAPMRPRKVLDPERVPLAAWLAALALAMLAIGVVQSVPSGLVRRLPWSEMALYSGLVGLGVAYAGGLRQGTLRSLLVASALFFLVVVVEQVAISIEAFLIGADAGAPSMAALVVCGVLRCASWAAAVALAVRLLGRSAPVLPRTRTGALLALTCASAAVAAVGIAMGFVNSWLMSASFSPGAPAAWISFFGVAVSGESLFALARWAAGSTALLAILGVNPLWTHCIARKTEASNRPV